MYNTKLMGSAPYNSARTIHIEDNTKLCRSKACLDYTDPASPLGTAVCMDTCRTSTTDSAPHSRARTIHVQQTDQALRLTAKPELYMYNRQTRLCPSQPSLKYTCTTDTHTHTPGSALWSSAWTSRHTTAYTPHNN